MSLVQSATGEVAPADEIVAAARAHGALVVADATQAAGRLPIGAGRFDVLAVSAYKWLMCPHGTAFCVSPAVRDRIRPIATNWYAGDGDASYGPPLRLAKDARRFDIAAPWFSYVAAAPRWSCSWKSASARSTTTMYGWPTGSGPALACRPATARSSPSPCRAPPSA
ncbi:aminotransferase class V-fold PLP-dependent enzyme [Actinoallomurus purpureus]|uniref:aminotransferase class V-fold PLP-dependent enzyme n=1 Tax=Actinoallomurus purpureus TaxID=478114 RepID=UPI0020930BEF|nr:aminotransferase class V-fold PLP-dependent enzyme [Actinoallomurus purpureus]MCO6009928.1 aminotransferase class V-fold PLP-dependent enzyme [Actinoallomurus purpureus]